MPGSNAVRLLALPSIVWRQLSFHVASLSRNNAINLKGLRWFLWNQESLFTILGFIFPQLVGQYKIAPGCRLFDYTPLRPQYWRRYLACNFQPWKQKTRLAVSPQVSLKMSNECTVERRCSGVRRGRGSPFLFRKRSDLISSGRIRNRRRGVPRTSPIILSASLSLWKSSLWVRHVDAVIAGGHTRLGETNRWLAYRETRLRAPRDIVGEMRK